MKNRYEALLVLDTKGREENVKDMIERLEGEFKKEGAAIEQVQKMDKRQFSYAPGALDSGYFVNFIFEGAPQVVDKLRARFKLDAEIYRQHYQKLRAPKASARKEKVAKAK
jgi:small subunit ribosomal protein S6